MTHTNLRVGVKVLQECIPRRIVQGGLAYYVGPPTQNDGCEKVLAEHYRLRSHPPGAVPPPAVARHAGHQAPAKAARRRIARTGASATGLGEKVALLTATDL